MSTLTYGKDKRNRDIIIAQGCEIPGGTYSNFAGREVKDKKTGQLYNAEGQRNFMFKIDNEEDLNLLREESVNVKLTVSDDPDQDDGIIDGKVRAKVRIEGGDPPLKIMIRSGIKDENGNYVETFKPLNLNRIAELDKLMFDNADFIFGISRKNPTHALYLNEAWLTVTYSPNPLELKYAGMYADEEEDKDEPAPAKVPVDMDEEIPFT